MTVSRPQRRLLFLLPFSPRLDAAHGGGRVIAQLLEALATRHRVAVLCFRGRDESHFDDELRQHCEWVEEVERPWTGKSLIQRWTRNVRLAASLAGCRPMWVTDWASGLYGARLRVRAREWQPDIVQAEFHVMGQYLSDLGGCRAACVLTEYEPGISAAPYLKQRLPILGHLLDRLDKLAWRRFEPAVLRGARAVVVFTERDRRALDALGAGVPIHSIPLGTAIPERALSPLGYPPLSLLFVGSAVHPPNADAAMRLARSIFPLVRESHPEAVLTLVGEQTPAGLRQLAGPNIMVTGRVPNVTPYLDRAAVFATPLRLGGGMRVKVLEALAAGKAVVASPLAAEGLDVRGGEQILFAESDQQFVACINELFDDPERRLALAREARAWACAHLRWDRSVAAYEAMYDSLSVGWEP